MKPKVPSSDPLTIISGLAYQLDSPLKSILAHTNKLLNDYKDRDFEYISYKDFQHIFSSLEQLKRQLEYCSQTTGRMLYIGKRSARLKEDSCQVNDVIKDIMDILSQQLKLSHIKLVLRLKKELPLASLGYIECHQIVHNLLINAIQAMPAGGPVKITTNLDSKDRCIAIQVDDEGIGITPEYLPKVFEPFFTTKERGVEKNAGLGLSIVYAIIKAVSGDVHITSSLRKGTSVHITIPIYQSQK